MVETVKYADGSVTLPVRQNEVKRYEIRVGDMDPEMQNTVNNCVFDKRFVGPSAAARLYVISYALRTVGKGAAKVSYLRVTVDTRLNCANLPEDPNQSRLGINVAFDPSADAVDCLLSIDLGNTRTVVLLADQINTAPSPDRPQVGVQFYNVKLNWERSAPSTMTVSGSFESVISLVNAESDGLDGIRLSFMKLGPHALHNNLGLSRSARGRGVYTMSSPKRYFYDQRPAAKRWLSNHYAGGKAEPAPTPLSGAVASVLAQNYDESLQSERMPTAGMLSGMLVEIFEQACYYTASAEFLRESGDDRPRRIRYVHVTYPSTFSGAERQVYKAKLQEGINAYLAHYRVAGGRHPVRVDVESCIDEATSVLALYAYCEIQKYYTAIAWAQTVGRRNRQTNTCQVRVGVIDIGGGTTDMSIANVIAMPNPGDPTAAKIQLIFQDGVNLAGDNFVISFIKDYVFEQGMRALPQLFVDGGPKIDEDVFRSTYNEYVEQYPSLVREFWFSLAIQLALQLDGIVEDAALEEAETLSDEVTSKERVLEFKVTDDAGNAWQSIFRAYEEKTNKKIFAECNFTSDKSVLKISIDDTALRAYKRTVEAVFDNVASCFGRTIAAFDCDQMLFAGKTAEFHYVRWVFGRHLPLTQCCSMKDYDTGGWCRIGKGGRVSDSKISTAMGGAFCALLSICAANNPVRLTFDMGDVINRGEYDWCIVPENAPAVMRFDTQLSVNEENCIELSFRGLPIRIARRRKGSIGMALLCYEVCLKNTGVRVDDALVTLGVINGEELCIVKVTGKCSDRQPLTENMVECRMYCFSGGKFWLDDGRI